MVNKKPKIFLFVGMILALGLSACSGISGNNGTALPTTVGGVQNQNLASTQNPFPAGVSGVGTSEAGASAVPSNTQGAQAPTGTAGTTAQVPATGGTPAMGATSMSTQESATPNASSTQDMASTQATSSTPGASIEQGTGTPVASGTQGVPSTGGQALLGASIVPGSARSQAVLLSNMMNYNVVDQNGNPIGKINDYILNMCESNIIYMVVNADPSLNLQGGNMLVIPYEVFTLGKGAIDVNQHNLVMPISASQVQGAPVVSQKPDLTNTNWESGVRSYWTNIVPLSALTTQCQVPQGPSSAGVSATPTSTVESTVQANNIMITKIAYASDVLGMQVQDGTRKPVGQVKEVYLVPESGRIRYLAVDLSSAQSAGTGTPAATSMSTPAATPQSTQSATQQANMKIVIMPIGAVNLMPAQSGQGQALVLVVQPSVLQNAPVMNSLPDVSQPNWDLQAFQYWNQYIPLTSAQQSTAEASTPTPAMTSTP